MDISKIKIENALYDLKDAVLRNKVGSANGIATLDANGKVPASQLNLVASVTYATLVLLRNNSLLIPGLFYRITDYVTTTTQKNTRSAGHQFDIIVRADDVNTLNENAYAALHSGDTYFANSKLETWELKYCLDNINWSQSSVQENIVVHDSEGSDTTCYYDGTTTISNVTYYKWKCEGGKIFGYFEYALTTAKSSGITAYVISNNVANDYGCTVLSYSPAIIDEGTGTITYMKDEYNNECPYDFKNIQFKVGVSSTAGTVANVFYYTFSVATGTNDATVTDHSLNGRYCYGNRMGKYFISGETKLNFNVFRNTTVTINCYDNTFDNNCRNNVFGLGCFNNTFGNECYSNTFGNNCRNNTFGNECYSNTFGNGCQNNMFGYNCRNNTFGNNLYGNTFGNECYSNTFGYNCRNNTFGNNCYSNTFSYECRSNTFGNECYSNTFGYNCRNNTFGNNCYSNTFGNGCQNNMFGYNCRNNTFGNNLYGNTFGNNCYSNTFGYNCRNNTFGNECYSNTFGNSGSTKSYYRYIIFENGCINISLNTTKTTSASNYIQNIKITQGVSGEIVHDNVGSSYQVEYRKESSQIVLI